MLVLSAINVPCAWTDPSPQDEDYKYSYGYYTNWEDIDEDADVRSPQYG